MIVLSLLLATAAPAPAVAPPVVRQVTHRRVARHIVQRKHRILAPLRLAGCGYSATGACPRTLSPYRLPLDEPLPPSGKARALAQTGTRCALIGQTICTSPPTTILHVEQ